MSLEVQSPSPSSTPGLNISLTVVQNGETVYYPDNSTIVVIKPTNLPTNLTTDNSWAGLLFSGPGCLPNTTVINNKFDLSIPGKLYSAVYVTLSNNIKLNDLTYKGRDAPNAYTLSDTNYNYTPVFNNSNILTKTPSTIKTPSTLERFENNNTSNIEHFSYLQITDNIILFLIISFIIYYIVTYMK